MKLRLQTSAYRHYTVDDLPDLAHNRYPRADEQVRQLASWTIVPILIDHNFSISTLAALLNTYYNVSFGFALDRDSIFHLLFWDYVPVIDCLR